MNPEQEKQAAYWRNKFGMLCNYTTGEQIRPATRKEWQESVEAQKSNIGGGTGAFVGEEGITVYVEGGPSPV